MDTTVSTASADTERRIPRPLLYGAGALVGVLVLAVALLIGLRAARAGALPGTTVNGVAVGGLEGDALRSAVVAAGRGDDTITITRGNATYTATGEEFGYRMDVDATVSEVLSRGRQLNPVAAFSDHLRAFSSPTPIDAQESLDEQALTARVEEAAEQLSTDPVEGDIAFEGTTVTRVDPQPGAVVQVQELTTRVRSALVDGTDTLVEAPVEAVPPTTTAEAMDRAFTLAQRAVSAPVTLSRGDVTLAFTPETIAEVIEVDRETGNLELSIGAVELAEHVPAEIVEALRTEPVDARFEVSGGAVSIVESSDGFAFDPQITAEQLLEVATQPGPRTAELAGEVLEPELSTTDAEGLGITEQVSTFTTEHACCQGRVTNIQRMADLVDGVVIEPDETFSLNGHVGERTRAKGFVDGGAIQNGEFVEEVGGGVSQFTTTMFNAAFFGGYAIPDYKAHSYYISRYPVGREATLNYPTVDLKVHNNSPHGILVKTSYSATSITVTFYGTKWVEVSDITGERRNPTSPPTRTVENPNLPRGASRVVSEGRGGFDITVTRILRFPDGREERETFNTRYLPEPRVIERNSSPPPQPPPPQPPPEQPPPEQPPPAEQQPPPGEPPPAGEPPPEG